MNTVGILFYTAEIVASYLLLSAEYDKNVWYRREITTETKIKVYHEVILTTVLYGCEVWTVFQSQSRKRYNFHTTSLRKLLGIKWQEKVHGTEVLTRADLPSVYTMLMKPQLRWA